MKRATAVLVRCRPHAPSICTDFFAARPSAFNQTAWGTASKRKTPHLMNNELSAYQVFRRAIESGAAKVWNVEKAHRVRGCRTWSHGVFHDHALCRRGAGSVTS